uniref:Uncharacterized protein n=1 Tax=Anguilla anguilla TaxID=7936 RepID=A0A0E9VDW1_ANGAN
MASNKRQSKANSLFSPSQVPG